MSLETIGTSPRKIEIKPWGERWKVTVNNAPIGIWTLRESAEQQARAYGWQPDPNESSQFAVNAANEAQGIVLAIGPTVRGY